MDEGGNDGEKVTCHHTNSKHMEEAVYVCTQCGRRFQIFRNRMLVVYIQLED